MSLNQARGALNQSRVLSESRFRLYVPVSKFAKLAAWKCLGLEKVEPHMSPSSLTSVNGAMHAIGVAWGDALVLDVPLFRGTYKGGTTVLAFLVGPFIL